MTPPKTPKSPALNIDRFPDNLRRQLKAQAALDGRTVRESVIEAIQMWVSAKQDGGVMRVPTTTTNRTRTRR